jgi:hypothetical protein
MKKILSHCPVYSTEPKSQDAKPRVWSGGHTLFDITHAGGEPQLHPGFGVLRCGSCTQLSHAQMDSQIKISQDFDSIFVNQYPAVRF